MSERQIAAYPDATAMSMNCIFCASARSPLASEGDVRDTTESAEEGRAREHHQGDADLDVVLNHPAPAQPTLRLLSSVKL